MSGIWGEGNELGQAGLDGPSTPEPVAETARAIAGIGAFSPQISMRYAAPDGSFGHDVDHAELRESFANLGIQPDHAMQLRRLATEPQDAKSDWADAARQVHAPAAIEAAGAAVAPHAELRKFLQASGVGNHADAIGLFSRPATLKEI